MTSSPPFPADPIAAVTHPEPYPFYARLTAERPLAFDHALGMWVAADAAAATAILGDPRCLVRPAAEPVPAALVGSSAGEIFGRLVRMIDGDAHRRLKEAVTAALSSVPGDEVGALSRRRARALLAAIPDGGPIPAANFAFALPAHVVGSLLGIPDDALPQTTRWLHDFVHCLASGSTAAEIAQGKGAAAHLRAFVGDLLTTSEVGAGSGLPRVLANEAIRAGCGDLDTVVANAIGFLFQSYEATAGLIGNTLLTLGDHSELRERAAADPDLLTMVIAESLRYDPPIQSTRRFVAETGSIAGQEMRAGDAILVLLAAANRDPAANPHPERFDTARQNPALFSFGVGTHACPGASLATLVATAGVEALLAAGHDRLPRRGATVYRRSANARVPLLTREVAA